MKKLILILSIVSLQACAANSKRDQLMQQQLALQQQEIELLKQSLAQKGQPQDGTSDEDAPTPAPMPPNVTATRSARVVRRKQDFYMANIGTTNRDLSGEYTKAVANHVCMEGKRAGLYCSPEWSKNEFVSFELEDGAPVFFRSSAYRVLPNGTTESFLPPSDPSAPIRLNIVTGPQTLTLRIKVYHRIFINGVPEYGEPYWTYAVRIDGRDGTTYDINEKRF